MKILVIAPTPFFSNRGTHIRILEEALALEKCGHEIKIATYHIGADISKNVATRIDVRRIRRWLFWYKKLEAGPDWQKIILDILLIKKTFFLARTWKPDILHGHLHEGVLIGWIVQRCLFWRSLKLVADFHGSLTKEMVSHSYLRATGLYKIFHIIEHFIDNLGERAVTSAWDNAEEINRIRTKNKATVLSDGTRLSMFEGVTDKETLRKEYRIPPNKVVIAYTGALIPNKGIRILLEAIPLVCEKFPQAYFVIAGFPVDQIANYLERASFEQHTTVITPLAYFDLPKILKMSDMGVDPKPATTRQASGKMLQYMGAGLPVVCFDTENNHAYLSEGGVYAENMTPESLAEAIGKLVQNPWLCEKKGMLNRERAKLFNWEKSAEAVEKIYAQLLVKR